MWRKAWFVGLILVGGLLAAPVALAQNGDGGKVIFGESYTLMTGEIQDGDLAIVGGNVTLQKDSVVRGDVVLLGGRLTADGIVTGNVAALGGHIVLGGSAVLDGDIALVGGSFEQAPGAVIQGEVLISLPSLDLVRLGIRATDMDANFPPEGFTGFMERFFFWQLRTFGASLLLVVLGIAVLLVARPSVGRVVSTLASQPALSFGMGLLTLLLALFAGALLLIACGLGLLVWLALLAGLILGWIGVGLWIGQRLLAILNTHTASLVPEVVIGVFLITVLASLPVCVGFFAWLILNSIGLGAVVLTCFGVRQAGADAPAPDALISS